MVGNDSSRPRLTVDITQEQSDRIKSLIPWGMRPQLIGCFLELLMTYAEFRGVGKTVEDLTKDRLIITFKPWIK